MAAAVSRTVDRITWFDVVPCREACFRRRRMLASAWKFFERRVDMRHSKELSACKAHLRVLLARDDIESGQKQAVQKGYGALARLGRIRHLTHAEIARCVRQVVVEALLRKPKY